MDGNDNEWNAERGAKRVGHHLNKTNMEGSISRQPVKSNRIEGQQWRD